MNLSRLCTAAGERTRQMLERATGFDGRHWETCRHRYDRLEDAASYARPMRERRRLGSEPPTMAAACVDLPIRTPTAAELMVMTKLGITMIEGLVECRGYQYDRLADVVGYDRREKLKCT